MPSAREVRISLGENLQVSPGLCRARPYFWVETAKKLRKWPFGSVRPGRIAANMLRTAERSFQRKNIGHAAEKQFWKGLRIEDFLLAGHKCTV